MLGVPTVWIAFSLTALPAVLWLWMLWSGNWRRPVLTAAVVYFSCFIVGAFGLVEEQIPPDKRMISLYGNGIKGMDVYCNGVHLGQTPLDIRVDELIAKVPEWTTPPEQRWYDDRDLDQRLTTWVPWDTFRKERFDALKTLYEVNNSRNAGSTSRAIQARREAWVKHDADCRYWWSYEFGNTQMAFLRSGGSYSLNTPFEKESNYYSPLPSSFSPSVGFHAQLLVDVLPELTPEQKADWDQYVLKHWSQIAIPLKRTLDQTVRHQKRNKNEVLAELYESALHSTARLKYGLSDPPTEDECRRILADWVEESIKSRVFYFSYSSNYYMPTVNDDVLLPADVNDSMRKPLAEQWKKNKYRSEDGWAPVVWFSGLNKSPDNFADFARWSATTGKARFVLLVNESPNTTALFNTLIHRRDLTEIFSRQIDLYPDQINTYSQINNPLVETALREFIIKALSDPDHNEYSRRMVENAVSGAIFQRIRREGVDKDELSAWVASLPLPAASKSLAQRTLRLHNDQPLTFADQLQHAAGQVLVETELTFDDVFQWFADNPEGSLSQFLEEQEENIMVSEMSNRNNSYRASYPGFTIDEETFMDRRNYGQWGGLEQCFITALLQSDSPEGDPRVRELVKRLWLDASTHAIVEQAIGSEYGTVNSRRNESAVDFGSLYRPEYILDLYLSAGTTDGSEEAGEQRPRPPINFNRADLAQTLALCDSPKAGEMLEKWANAPVPPGAVASPRIKRCLEIWQTRNALRQRKMEVFQDLVAGRMSPDDLLLPQPAWVWKDGKYVQKP